MLNPNYSRNGPQAGWDVDDTRSRTGPQERQEHLCGPYHTGDIGGEETLHLRYLGCLTRVQRVRLGGHTCRVKGQVSGVR